MNGRLVMGALAMLWPVTARADPLERGALHLEWSAPGGCPNGVEVLERIEALLGARIADLRPEPISARGNVVAVEALRFELTLETQQRGQRYVRSMQAPSCAELGDAGSLVLALAIDPELVELQARAAETKQPETSTLATEAPPAPPAPEVPKVPPPPPPRDSSPRRDDERADEPIRPTDAPEWFARLGLLADFGTVSDASFGPRATVAAGFGAFRAELGLSWLPPVRSFTARNPDRGGDIDLLATDLDGCFLPFRGDLELQGCAGVEVGRLHGSGFGTVVEREGSALWLGASLTLLGRLQATRALTVVAAGGPLFVPQDTEFTLENVGVVHTVPKVVSRFGLGIEAALE
jgi:hypothetical protein